MDIKSRTLLTCSSVSNKKKNLYLICFHSLFILYCWLINDPILILPLTWIRDTGFSSEGEEGMVSNVEALLKSDACILTTAFSQNW